VDYRCSSRTGSRGGRGITSFLVPTHNTTQTEADTSLGVLTETTLAAVGQLNTWSQLLGLRVSEFINPSMTVVTGIQVTETLEGSQGTTELTLPLDVGLTMLSTLGLLPLFGIQTTVLAQGLGIWCCSRLTTLLLTIHIYLTTVSTDMEHVSTKHIVIEGPLIVSLQLEELLL